MHARQDAPGPDHGPETRTTTIDGVLVQRFPTVPYTYGGLTELNNKSWSSIFSEPVEHLYLVANDGSGRREEWYEHRLTTDRYVMIEGAARVALFDGRHDGPTSGTLELHDLVSVREGWAGLRIPPGVWHSFCITGDRMLLMNAKSPGYDRESPDKYRMPMPNPVVDFTWDDEG